MGGVVGGLCVRDGVVGGAKDVCLWAAERAAGGFNSIVERLW